MFGGPENYGAETEGRPGRGKKGRPRIQGGQVPHDRRKTQLRLAQRAYRSRKEATLQSLKSRVHQLEMIVEQINETFLFFLDEVMNCNALASYPDLAEKLHQTLEQSLSLANQAISVAHDDDDERDCNTSAADAEVPEMPKKQVAPPTSNILECGHHVQGLPREEKSKDLNQGSQNQSNIKLPEKLTGVVQSLPMQSSIHVPLTSIYEPERGGFAHRLHRSCLEYGYRNLRNPSSQTEQLTRRFRLPLTIMTPLNLILHFEESLRYGAMMELNMPFFSIGGAGMHFKHDQRSYTSDNGTLRSDVVHISPDQIGQDMGGDWFDCYDVEGYLKRANIVPVRELSLSTKLSSAHLLDSNANLHARYFSDNNDKVIDEIVFIELLTRSCYCLGRAPGFARRTVESFIMELAKSC